MLHIALWFLAVLTAAVIGAGPSGLMAAEVLAQGGARVTIHDRMAAPARKFLMAGRGGLNLTHSEPLDSFLDRYGPARPMLEPAIRAFPPQAVRNWCHGLGIETFVGSSGRVFPSTMKASPLLRAWLRRLGGLGVELKRRSEWRGPDGSTDITILAMGGASWPKLGSDGSWVAVLRGLGTEISDLTPSNSGVITDWSAHFAERFAGSPLKRIGITCGGRTSRGEAIVTRRGLEGGAIYGLSRELREAKEIVIDLRPDMSEEQVAARLARPRGKDSTSNWLRKSLNLPPVAIALLRERDAAPSAAAIKRLAVPVSGIEGLERAISSAGGIARSELDENFQLRRLPGVYAVGEMLDWEAPTGGYLLQACFSTGHWAARHALTLG
ncbi:MAG: TIGR03862 family flavoprotein [Rhizobiales bacterium]|nr:TIGR03862 family flavoprotein [Hyphomicrobiales bacterium]